jgi:hypothetical protein
MMSKIFSIISKITYFLHISDGQGQLDIVDLSFMAVIVKLMFAPNLDWQAVCTMIPLIASQMHTNHLSYLAGQSQSVPPTS